MGPSPVIPVPRTAILIWTLSALAAGAALALSFGFAEPVVTEQLLRTVLLSAVGLFALSRLILLIPSSLTGAHLRRWWVDYVLILAGLVWWRIDPTKETILLEIAAVYSLGLGVLIALKAGARRLVHQSSGIHPPIGGRLVLAGLICVLLGGVVLSLPVCWDGPYPVSSFTNMPAQARYELRMHLLDCTFTAATALSGTGLSVQEIGYEFSRTGWIVIMVLMEIGGLVALSVGTVVGWRLRDLLGLGARDDDLSVAGLRRLLGYVIALAVLLELAGGALLFDMFRSVDSSWATSQDQILAGAFHAISAFCNTGLTLTSDSLVEYRDQTALWSAIFPLMLLGSLGGPVLYELCRRLLRRQGMGLLSLSRHGQITLLATFLLIAGTAGLLYFVESTPDLQLRNPRENTPGRLLLNDAASRPATLPLSTRAIERAASERLSSMPDCQRWENAFFLSVAARSGGLRTVRLDEHSLAPASRVLLAGAMLIGGSVGGTAGGLRLAVFLLLLSTLGARGRTVTNGPRATGRQQAMLCATSVAVWLLLLTVLTALALTYRETGSLTACLFEAVSATCNVGFSAGLTPQLSAQGRIVLILAMTLGRLIPLALLLRCLQVPMTVAPVVTASQPAPATPPPAPERSDEPIPLE